MLRSIRCLCRGASVHHICHSAIECFFCRPRICPALCSQERGFRHRSEHHLAMERCDHSWLTAEARFWAESVRFGVGNPDEIFFHHPCYWNGPTMLQWWKRLGSGKTMATTISLSVWWVGKRTEGDQISQLLPCLDYTYAHWMVVEQRWGPFCPNAVHPSMVHEIDGSMRHAR